MSSEHSLLWHGAELRPDPAPTGVPLRVADSWLVTGGSMLALSLHRSRFVEAATDAGAHDSDVFFDTVVAAIPREGDWFPRVELNADGDLVARIRPAPPRGRSLALSTAASDPRITPNIKGPSIAALEGLREAARASGADEAVILNPAGHIVEGATTALMWWRGDALCLPARGLERVDSVTARTVLALATALGVDILWEETTPEELDGHELWALNALHGIRIVTDWITGPGLAEKPGRLSEWRARLDGLRRPAPEPQHG